jgi:Uma2 family endonuclease
MSMAVANRGVVLDPRRYEGIHLLEEDGVPVETPWHRNEINLLNASLVHHYRDRDDFYVGGDMFIYYNPDQARNLDYRGPDFFYVNKVDRHRERRYWAVWEEDGRLPDVIVELLSPTTADEDRTTKKTIYEQTFQTAEYYCYDPDTQQLEGWRLVAGCYEPIAPNEKGWLWSEQLQLWLGTWQGEYQGTRATWLRFYDAQGQLVLLADEWEHQRAENERQRAENERQRAENERQRADDERQRAENERQRAQAAEGELARLKAWLAQQGLAPEQPNGNAP